jgi:hypothetical protein
MRSAWPGPRTTQQEERDDVLERVLFLAVIVAATILAITVLVFAFWRTRSWLRVRAAGPTPMRAVRRVIWRDPGEVELCDFVGGPGGRDGAPVPPFRFVEEQFGGSSPSVTVEDGAGRRWRVKWGDEVRTEAFAVRLVWAVGYFAESTYFVRRGEITGAGELSRAQACLDLLGRFSDARFEIEEPDHVLMFEEHSWAWNDNPFVGTHELNGLKILMMLLSNWDNKDVRDVVRGSNTAIFECRLPGGTLEARYLIIDWGGTLGRWGSTLVTRGRWDCDAFRAQTPQLVTGVSEGLVQWGYTGQRTLDAARDIRVQDVRWLLRYLGRVQDHQLRDGLLASGATAEETECFTAALRERIEILRVVAEEGRV